MNCYISQHVLLPLSTPRNMADKNLQPLSQQVSVSLLSLSRCDRAIMTLLLVFVISCLCVSESWTTFGRPILTVREILSILLYNDISEISSDLFACPPIIQHSQHYIKTGSVWHARTLFLTFKEHIAHVDILHFIKYSFCLFYSFRYLCDASYI